MPQLPAAWFVGVVVLRKLALFIIITARSECIASFFAGVVPEVDLAAVA